jgi:ribosomal protein L19E
MSIHSTGLGEDEPLVVSPRRTASMLDCGLTKVYQLINDDEVDSFKDGASRKIVVASIKAYIARQLERSRTSSRMLEPHDPVAQGAAAGIGIGEASGAPEGTPPEAHRQAAPDIRAQHDPRVRRMRSSATERRT